MYEKYEPCFKVLTARSLARSFRFPEWLLQSDDGESGDATTPKLKIQSVNLATERPQNRFMSLLNGPNT